MIAAACFGVGAVWIGIVLAYDSFYWPPAGRGWPVSFFVVTLIVAGYLLTYLRRGPPAATRRRSRGSGARVFTGLMLNTWIAGTVVAVIAGVMGFFAVLRGSTFAAHAIPNGAFAGAAGATLLGFDPLAGLAVFSVAGALGIAGLSRRARSDVATALILVHDARPSARCS